MGGIMMVISNKLGPDFVRPMCFKGDCVCFQGLEVLVSEVTDWFAFPFPLVVLSYISVSIFIQIIVS